jgi:FKBP-type peptidyl-prolyl cis-trans isomerase SlyD
MKIAKGCQVTIEYQLFVDGEVVDSSRARGPLSYEQGRGQILQRLETVLEGKEAGDEFEIDISPEDAYGIRDERAVQEVPRTALPDTISPEEGRVLQVKAQGGQVFQAVIVEVKPDVILIDLNHPLAGKILRFKIQILTVNSPLQT